LGKLPALTNVSESVADPMFALLSEHRAAVRDIEHVCNEGYDSNTAPVLADPLAGEATHRRVEVGERVPLSITSPLGAGLAVSSSAPGACRYWS